jgi:glycine cleavage system transcriptional repressor
MKRLLLTISGQDKPGIIAEVSGLLFRKGCNLEDISMTLLEGQFAMMMTVCVPGKAGASGLAEALSALKKAPWNMECFLTGLKGKASRGKKLAAGCGSYVVTAFGKDRTGIVYEVSRCLAKEKVNITDLDSRILGQGKKVTYAMLLEVDVPNRLGQPMLKKILDRVAQKLRIEIQVRPIEPLAI